MPKSIDFIVSVKIKVLQWAAAMDNLQNGALFKLFNKSEFVYSSIRPDHVRMEISSMWKLLAREWKLFKQNAELLLLTMPAAIYILIFAYLPMYGIVLAFKDFKYNLGILGSKWIGLDNFKFMFMTDTAWRITRNTICMNALFIVFGTLAALAVALLLFEISEKLPVRVYQSVLIFPRLLSWVVIGYMFYGIMNPQYGLLNNLLQQLGMERVDWYSKPALWPGILVIAYLWQSTGMGSVLYFATLVGIEKDYFDAAAIDGATKWQVTRHLTIPFLYPIMTLLLILSIGSIIRADFGLFYTLTRDVPTIYSTTDVIDTYVFRALRRLGDTGMAAAAGFYQSVVGFALILITNTLVRRFAPENSLF